MSNQRRIDWDDPQYKSMLGTMPDAELAKMLGKTTEAIGMARRARRISNPHQKAIPRRLPVDRFEVAKHFGTLTDAQIAEKFGITISYVRDIRIAGGHKSTRINWYTIPLGTRPDRYFAKLYDVDEHIPIEARERRGIPRWSERRKCPCGNEFVTELEKTIYCSTSCQRYRWQLIKEGDQPEIADLKLALRQLRRTQKQKARNPCGRIPANS